MLLNVFVFVMVLFTSSGPAEMSTLVGDKETCSEMVSQSSAFVGQKVPGPGGAGTEQVTVLDVKAKCYSFTQGTVANK